MPALALNAADVFPAAGTDAANPFTNMGSINVGGSITINNSMTNGVISQFYVRANVSGHMYLNASSPSVGNTLLYMYDCAISGVIDSPIIPLKWTLQQARGVTFSNGVNIDTYGTINNCAFLDGSNLITSGVLNGGGNQPFGIYETFWAAGAAFTLSGGPAGSVGYNTLIFQLMGSTDAVIIVDSVTNYWMNFNNITVFNGICILLYFTLYLILRSTFYRDPCHLYV
jgi:hypothetical protein